jgi:RNA recognition motif-containing protein
MDEPATKKSRKKRGWDVTPSSITSETNSINLVETITQNPTLNDNDNIQIQQALQQALAKASTITSSVASSLKGGIGGKYQQENRIFVGNIYYNVSSEELQALFSPFGTIVNIEMSSAGEGTKHKGFCFIDFLHTDSATAAIDAMEGFELANRNIICRRPAQYTAQQAANLSGVTPTTINVLSAKDQAKALLSSTLLSSNSHVNNLPDKIDSSILLSASLLLDTKFIIVKNVHSAITADELKLIFSPFGAINSCAFYGESSTLQSTDVIVKNACIEFNNIHSAQDCSLNMNCFPLAGIMILVELALKNPIEKIKGHNNRWSIILENMISIEEESSDPHFKQEIYDEMTKFGNVQNVNIIVDGNSAVKVIVSYEKESEVKYALTKMDKRYFGGRQIRATINNN